MRACKALCLAAALTGIQTAGAQEPMFQSRRITPPGEYTAGIEGPAVGADGALYVPNFAKAGTIGRLRPGAVRSEVYASLPQGSIGNGTRFDRNGRMYVADYRGHTVFVFERGQTIPHVYFHSDRFDQPNDLAIARDGTLYASDPNFRKGGGRVWMIERQPNGTGRGAPMDCERRMGTANGIDLSPDGTTLYVSESATREIWAYRLDGSKLTDARLIRRFDSGELDGLRTDLDGRIFVARPSVSTIAILAPDGSLEREVRLLGSVPTNLTFGGEDGRTVFVTQRDGRYIEAFTAERPGREPCLQSPGPACASADR